jgi:hypothetical protein
MTHRSPDERLRQAADCRLRGLGPYPNPSAWVTRKPGYLIQNLFKAKAEPGPGIEAVGSEFQPSFDIAYTLRDPHIPPLCKGGPGGI